MSGYSARVFSSWDAVPAEWRDPARAPTPFQTHAFLSAWYATLGSQPGVSPVIVELRDRHGDAVALWPFAATVCNGLKEIGFADGELTDNCAPLTGPAFPHDPAGLREVWRTGTSALPSADLLRLQKLSFEGSQGESWRRSMPGLHRSPLSRHLVDMHGTFEEYSARRTTKFSKEQRRVWRVFTRNDGAAFEIVADPSRASMLFAQFETLQEARMREIGVDYRLGRPEYRAFSKLLIENGVANGSVVFGALTAYDELVGGAIGLSNGRNVSFVRICFSPGRWTASSPGRLVLEKTMEALHARGLRTVDLSVGDFPYKHDFGVTLEPLYATVIPLSLRGRPAWAVDAMRWKLKQSATLRNLRARFVGGRSGKSPAS